MEKIVVFAAGNTFKRWCEEGGVLDDYEIVAIVDNDKNKWGTYIKNIEIQPPRIGLKNEFDKILILSFAESEIREQLRDSFGIEEQYILTERDMIIKLYKKWYEKGCIGLMHNLLNVQALRKSDVSSIEDEIVDDIIVDRIIATYNRVLIKNQEKKDSWWTNGWIWEGKKDVHKILLAKNHTAMQNILRNPADNNILLGFDNLTKSDQLLWWIPLIYDSLIQLSALLRVIRMPNPELNQIPIIDLDDVLDKLSEKLEMDLKFPNPYPGEIGIRTKRGIIGYRAIQSLYQAYRIKEILGKNAKDTKVLEIGAGLGRTAYFAYQMGIRNYTIIDLPMTNVAQAYFLGRVLGEEYITLVGETNNKGIKIFSVDMLNELQEEKFDLILNVDSITEMDEESQIKYWKFIQNRTKKFFSINHEANSHIVSEYYVNTDYNVRRSICPMRKGYLEEEIYFE